MKVFVREVVVHDDRGDGQGGEFDLRFGVIGDDDLPDNRFAAHWQSDVVSGQTFDVLGWLGPVTVTPAGGLLAVACAGTAADLLTDNPVLGGIAWLAPEEGWRVGRWWQTANGQHCNFVFTVVRGGEGDQPAGAPGPTEPLPVDYRAVLG